MLRQYFDNTTALGARSYIPLEVTAAVVKNSAKLVRNEFVRRENTERYGVSNKWEGGAIAKKLKVSHKNARSE